MTRAMRRLRDSGFDLATSTSAPEALRIRSMVEGLAEVASAVERRWGVGRLRQLASDPLRLRFDEQQSRVDAAVASGEERFVRIQTEAMRRAWETLERAAIETGVMPLSADVWETALPKTGEVVAIVRSEIDLAQVASGCPAFTLAEIALLIEKLGPEALETKRVFRGAVVTDMRASETFDWSKGDDMPF